VTWRDRRLEPLALVLIVLAGTALAAYWALSIDE